MFNLVFVVFVLGSPVQTTAGVYQSAVSCQQAALSIIQIMKSASPNIHGAYGCFPQ